MGDAAGSRDIVGDATGPAFYVAADADHLYFRLRVNADPAQGAGLDAHAWGCLIDTDGDPSDYELSVFVDGAANPETVSLFRNTTTLMANSALDVPDLPAVSSVTDPVAPSVAHAAVAPAGSSFAQDPDYFIEWAVERSAAGAAAFDPAGPTRYLCGSSDSASTLDADVAGGDTAGTLDSRFSDLIACPTTGCSVCVSGSCGACGDGTKAAAEACDDGNVLDGDGCSSQCLSEVGSACTEDADCESDNCDSASKTCHEASPVVTCDTDAACGARRCDPTKHICVDCLSDADCDGGSCDTSGVCTVDPAHEAAVRAQGDTVFCSARPGAGSKSAGLTIVGLLGLFIVRSKSRRSAKGK
jgi:cysteine-rich repeat protein